METIPKMDFGAGMVHYNGRSDLWNLVQLEFYLCCFISTYTSLKFFNVGSFLKSSDSFGNPCGVVDFSYTGLPPLVPIFTFVVLDLVLLKEFDLESLSKTPSVESLAAIAISLRFFLDLPLN